jgi:hypothetical protein
MDALAGDPASRTKAWIKFNSKPITFMVEAQSKQNAPGI